MMRPADPGPFAAGMGIADRIVIERIGRRIAYPADDIGVADGHRVIGLRAIGRNSGGRRGVGLCARDRDQQGQRRGKERPRGCFNG